jgi:hypothetical protein
LHAIVDDAPSFPAARLGHRLVQQFTHRR